MSESDLQAAEKISLAMIPSIKRVIEKVDDPQAFWVGLIIALTSMAHIDLGDEGVELIVAAAKVGFGALPLGDPPA